MAPGREVRQGYSCFPFWPALLRSNGVVSGLAPLIFWLKNHKVQVWPPTFTPTCKINGDVKTTCGGLNLSFYFDLIYIVDKT